jgi:methionyl aminopeptidase
MIYYKTTEEIELIRQNGEILGKAHAEIAKLIAPGISTLQLDKRAEEFIKDNNGSPSFKGYNGFPYTLCVSVNEHVVHGFPGKYILKEGDIISVDCGVYRNGFHADSAYTYPVGEISQEVKKLLRVTKECLAQAIEAFTINARIGDISFAVQQHAESQGFSVVRELVGHGVGRNLHEGPEVPNYGKRGKGPKITNGLVVAIEPMINLGKKNVVQEEDGWTIRTLDKLPSAHFEHTVAMHNDKVDVLTTFQYIEEVISV